MTSQPDTSRLASFVGGGGGGGRGCGSQTRACLCERDMCGNESRCGVVLSGGLSIPKYQYASTRPIAGFGGCRPSRLRSQQQPARLGAADRRRGGWRTAAEQPTAPRRRRIDGQRRAGAANHPVPNRLVARQQHRLAAAQRAEADRRPSDRSTPHRRAPRAKQPRPARPRGLPPMRLVAASRGLPRQRRRRRRSDSGANGRPTRKRMLRIAAVASPRSSHPLGPSTRRSRSAPTSRASRTGRRRSRRRALTSRSTRSS